MPDSASVKSSAILKAANAGHALLPAGPAVGTDVASAAGANTYGAYVQFRAAAGNAIYIRGLHVSSKLASDTDTLYAQFMIGTGGAAAEVAVSEVNTAQNEGTTGDGIMPMIPIWPWIAVAASTRIAVKSADLSGNAISWPVKLAVIDQANVVAG